MPGSGRRGASQTPQYVLLLYWFPISCAPLILFLTFGQNLAGSGKRLWFDRKSNGSPPRDPAPGLSGLVPSPERIKMPAPGKRLRFERRSNWATPSEWIHRVPDTTTSPERASKRPKNASVGPTKGILKSPPSGAVNSPAQKHAQEAITFSQRQMHDIESLATKLLRGLRSMKGIVEEALTSEESSSAASLKDHTDKVTFKSQVKKKKKKKKSLCSAPDFL